MEIPTKKIQAKGRTHSKCDKPSAINPTAKTIDVTKTGKICKSLVLLSFCVII